MTVVPILRPFISTHIDKRQVPEIEGSQGGFIGLVVALSVLILICCTAVFHLLRHHEPTDQDRVIRRERYRRTRESREADVTSTTTPSSSALGSIKEKFKRLWGHDQTSSTGKSSSSHRRGGRGWIQAGSGDQWESHSELGDPELAGQTRARPKDERLPSLSKQDIDHSDPAHTVESPLSDTGIGFIPITYANIDPYSKESPLSHTVSPSPLSPLQPELGRSQSPLSSNSPRESSSAEEEACLDDTHAPDHRHRTTLYNASVWTQTGSKFVEDI